jgi:biotin transport system substrate-specific component
MKTREMVYAALFAGIMAVLGLLPPIPMPLGVPITLQTFGVMLAGGLLGKRVGSISMLLFILLVAIGLPVLSGGRGGIAILFGPTGGYIFSWPIAAFLLGLFVERYWNKLRVTSLFVANILIGIIVVYVFGIAYFVLVTDVGLLAAVLGNLIFIPGDLLKAFLAAWIVVRIKRTYPQLKLF